VDDHQRPTELSGYTVDQVRKLMRLKSVDGVFRGVMWSIEKDSHEAYLELVDSPREEGSRPEGIDAARQAMGAKR
jgi:hypothetical protein